MATRGGALAVAGALLLAAGPGAAEIPPLPREQLTADAALIVTGTVTAVRAKKLPPAKSGLKETRHFLSVAVRRVEKGKLDGAAKSLTAVGSSYVLPPGAAGTAGIRSDTWDYIDDVRKGWELTLYLRAGKDGAYEILSPNGLSVRRKPGEAKGR